MSRKAFPVEEVNSADIRVSLGNGKSSVAPAKDLPVGEVT